MQPQPHWSAAVLTVEFEYTFDSKQAQSSLVELLVQLFTWIFSTSCTGVQQICRSHCTGTYTAWGVEMAPLYRSSGLLFACQAAAWAGRIIIPTYIHQVCSNNVSVIELHHYASVWSPEGTWHRLLLGLFCWRHCQAQPGQSPLLVPAHGRLWANVET